MGILQRRDETRSGDPAEGKVYIASAWGSRREEKGRRECESGVTWERGGY